MFLTELFEATERRVVVIYSGRFQPFHLGHAKVYQYLVSKYGRNNVYIGTSNKVEAPDSPFSFADRLYFMQLMGIPADRVLEIPRPYNKEEAVRALGISSAEEANIILIFPVSAKDMHGDPKLGIPPDPRFSKFTKKDGQPTWTQPLPPAGHQVNGMDQSAYIEEVPTYPFKVLGKSVTGATSIREMYSAGDEAQRQQIIKDLYGKYTPEAEKLMTDRLMAPPVEKPAKPVKLPKPLKPQGGLDKIAVKQQRAGKKAVGV